MLLTATFLSTVSRIPFELRLELAFIHLLCTIAFFIASVIDADILELYATAIGRMSCLVMVGYAVIPGFNGTFGGIIRGTAGQVIYQLRKLRLSK